MRTFLCLAFLSLCVCLYAEHDEPPSGGRRYMDETAEPSDPNDTTQLRTLIADALVLRDEAQRQLAAIGAPLAYNVEGEYPGEIELPHAPIRGAEPTGQGVLVNPE